jgi:hypothetical protein
MEAVYIVAGILVVIAILVIIFIAISFKKNTPGPDDPVPPSKDCKDNTPCKVNGVCVVHCIGDNEIDQCPRSDGTCQQCPAGTVISDDRKTCDESRECNPPNLLCDQVCKEPKDLCWNGTCPGSECPPDVDAIWKALMEFFAGIFTVQGVISMAEYEAFSRAVQSLKGALERAETSFTEDTFVNSMRLKINKPISAKVTEHLENTNPFNKFKKFITKDVGNLFKHKPLMNVFKSLQQIPEFKGKDDAAIRDIISKMTEAQMKELTDKTSLKIVDNTMKESAKEFLNKIAERSLANIASSIDPLMWVVDGFMAAGMILDMLGLGGWTAVFNTETINKIMDTNKESFIDSCIEQTGLYPVIVGPLVCWAMRYEYGSVSQSLEYVETANLASETNFPFNREGKGSPLFIHVCHRLYNEWVVDQGMTSSEISYRFRTLIEEIPLDIFAGFMEEAEQITCEKMGGVYFNPFGGNPDFTDPPPPWGKVCSFKNQEDTDGINNWSPGEGAEFANFEWRSKAYLESIPLMFENSDEPIYLSFPDGIDGASILVDDSTHRFCNTGQSVHFHSRVLNMLYIHLIKHMIQERVYVIIIQNSVTYGV